MAQRVPAFFSALVIAAAFGVAGLVSPAAAQDPAPATSPTPTPAPALVPPRVVTGAADGIGRDGATLAGTLISGQAETTARFEYGTSTAYGLTTGTQVWPASEATAVARQAISGLSANTTYHFRLIATNAAGTTVGGDATFRTAAIPARPSIASAAAGGIRPDGATLPARVDPKGQPAVYSFQFGLTKSLGAQTEPVGLGAATQSTPVSQAIGGLLPNTRYYFRAVAMNAAGTTYGRTRTFTTLRAVGDVTIRAARSTVAYNGSTVILGQVKGDGVGGVKVALMRQDFPFSAAPKEVATQTTTAAGTYTFSVGPLRAATKLWVQTRTTPFKSSALAAIRSQLLVQLRTERTTRRSATLRGHVYPRIGSGYASLQRRSSKGRWVTIRRPKLSHSKAANRSSFTTTVSKARSTTKYRVLVTPRDAGAHERTASRSVTVGRRRAADPGGEALSS